MSWPMIPLGEAVTFKGGGTPSRDVAAYWNGSIPWATVKDLNTGYTIRSTQESITAEGLQRSASNLIPAGTVIIPTRMALGKAVISEVDVAINQDLKAVLPKTSIDSRFLMWFFVVNGSKIEAMGKGATVKGVTLDQLERLQFPLPPLTEQRRIAAILDKADALRAKRREAITKLDQLLQSVFLDMFGDPVTNPKGWKFVECQELCVSSDDIKCGPFGTQLAQSEFCTVGVPLWGIRHVNVDFSRYTHEFLTSEKAKKLSAYSIESGDLVMTRKGTVGRCAIYPSNLPTGVMHSDLLRVRLNKDACSPIFIRDQLRLSPLVARQVEVMSSGAIMAGINVSKLKKLSVFAPPLDIQRRYAQVVNDGIRVLETKWKSSDIHMDSLFSSVQQRAFAGAL